MQRLFHLKRTILYLCLILSSGCNQTSREGSVGTPFILHGKLENKTSGRIFLSALVDRHFVGRDTARIENDGSFQFDGTLAGPDIYKISISPDSGLLLVIDASRIEVSADARDLPQTYDVKGSGESILLKTLLEAAEKHRRDVSILEKRFLAAREAGKQDSILYYQEKFLLLQAEKDENIKKFIRKNPESFVATYAAYAMIDREAEGGFLDSMLMTFDKKFKGSGFVQSLHAWAEKNNNLSVGARAPDLTLPQPDDRLLTLSSLRGKYVLLDFWASWCRPCREENPNVVKLYNRYKEKGFEILGISLDESKTQWVKAIEKDGLPWRHVSDLKGSNSVASRLYKVQAIPMTVLLDKEGRIMALNLRGDTLEEKLRSLFGE